MNSYTVEIKKTYSGEPITIFLQHFDNLAEARKFFTKIKRKPDKKYEIMILKLNNRILNYSVLNKRNLKNDKQD